jgi:prepilin-type N-terminal cleavage/methylation domain-containing protein
MQALPRRGEKGYSLVEALVVVALIGLFSVIAVPNFIQMYRSNKLKSSLRNFTGDLRWARQKAVSETIVVVCSFPPVGATSTEYRFYRGRLDIDGEVDEATLATLNDSGGNQVARNMEEDVFFNSTTFTDSVDTTGVRAADTGYVDIVFLTNGTLKATGTPQVQITTDKPIPVPTFNVNFSVAGGLKAERP